jgi:hypothetical protein
MAKTIKTGEYEIQAYPDGECVLVLDYYDTSYKQTRIKIDNNLNNNLHNWILARTIQKTD